MSLKTKLHEALVPEARERGISWTNILIIVLVLMSFVVFALETEPTLAEQAKWAKGFAIFNVAVIIIFAIEYVLRVWVAGVREEYRGVSGRIRYMLRFYSIADVLAFLPELLLMIFGGGMSTVALRVLRLARLIKLARFVPAFDILAAALKRSGTQLLTTLALAMALVYLSAVCLYFVEGVGGMQQESFASVPRSIWWAVATLTTVGYGDVYPVTPLGRFFASFIALAGIGVVALPTGVFASAFADELRSRERSAEEAAIADVQDEIEDLQEDIEDLRADLKNQD